MFVELVKSKLVMMVGLDYKDECEVVLFWLVCNGDFYLLFVYDCDGKVGMDFGVYGVFEIFIVDKVGIVCYK